MGAGTVELATAYFQMIPSMAGAEATIGSQLLPASAAAGGKAGAGIGLTLLAGLKKFAGPIAVLAAGFSVAKIIKSSVEAFDGLATSTRNLQLIAGGSASQVSGLAGSMQLAGLSSDKAQSALTIFQKNLGNATASGTKTAAMAKLLGGNFLDASGQVKPMSDIMPMLADKFESMPAGANKTALAMQLFGRSGAQMIPYLNEGSAGIANLTGQAKAMGLVLSDQSMNVWWNAQLAAKAYTAAVTGTKAALGQDLGPVMDSVANIGRSIMTPMLEAMTSGFQKLGPSMMAGAEKLDAFAERAGDAMKEVIGGFEHGTDAAGSSQTVFATIGSTIYGVFSKIGSIVGPVISAFKPMFAQLAPVFQSLIPQVMAVFSALSPTQLIFKALIPVLPQLVSIVGTLAATLGGVLGKVLGEILPPITQVVAMLAGGLTKVIVMMLPLITRLATLIGGSLGNEMKALAPIIAQIVPILGTILSAALKQLMPIIMLLATTLGTVLTAVMPLVPALMPLVNAVLSLIAPLLQLITPILTPLIQLFSALLTPILALITPLLGILIPVIQFLATVLAAVVGWLAQALTWFVGLITGSKSVQKGIADAWGGIMGFFSGMWTSIGNWFATGIGTILGFFTGLPGKVLGALAGAATWLVDVGKNMIQGLLNGAGALLKNIGTFFLKIVPSWILAPFKAALGIHSPSTVFAELGGNITAGLMQGVAGGKPAIDTQMRALVTVPSAAAATSASAATGTALSAGAPIYVQNPFTGEYLLAKVTTVAQGVVKQADAEDDATARGGSIL